MTERERMAGRLDRMFVMCQEKEQAVRNGYDMTVDYAVLRAFIMHGESQWKQELTKMLRK